MRWTPIFKDLGLFVQLPAVLAVPSAGVCMAFGEWSLLPGFGIVAAVSFGLGQYLTRRPIADESSHSPVGSMVTVGAAWLAIGLIAAIPFFYWGRTSTGAAGAPFGDYWTALFESMSGITSTGLTMSEDASLLPRTIQWWRTLLEWIGGVGVVVLALAVIRPAEAGKVLMTAEAREHRIGPSFTATGRHIWWLFAALTVLSIGMFRAVGMPWWEAINHGMTGIATGGFTVTANSFAGYSNAVRIAAILIMLLGAISFRTYATAAIDRNWRAVVADVPTRVLLALFAFGTAALIAVDYSTAADRDALAIAFQWASALGTCGFQTTELSAWTGPLLIFLTMAMFVGGTSGSTTGGIKVDRAILVSLGPIWHMRRRLSTRKGVQYYVIEGEKVKELDALQRYRGAVVLTSMFVTTIVAGTAILLLTVGPGYMPHEVLFEVTSAMSNVGLTTGLTGPTIPWVAKLTMILVMWMGRLEITAVLVFIGLPILLAARNSKAKKS